MIEEVRSFLEGFTSAEANAYSAYFRPNIEAFNEAYQKMNSFLTAEMHDRMGLISLTQPEPDDHYEGYEDLGEYEPRIICKISHYIHPKLNNIWIGYCSTKNPDDFDIDIYSAFVICESDGRMQILAEFRFSNFSSDGVEYEWRKASGVGELDFENLGKIEEVHRYVEPMDDRSKDIYFGNV